MSVDFRVITVGPIETNCYFVWDRDTRKSAIIDPGGDKDSIVHAVSSLNLHVDWVLLTHGHWDHCFYAGPLVCEYGARFGMHALDLVQMSQSLDIAEMFHDLSEFISLAPTDLLNDGDVISLGDSEIRVVHTPGHSQGGLCFVTDAGIFCGDTIFAGAVGRTDFPGGSHEQLIDSIRTHLLTLDDATPLYPGHGPATTVGAERRGNFF